jgi:exopolyphosphatase/guanosine-5'-triphosphate,3'-diphosphate pyrophosphatase
MDLGSNTLRLLVAEVHKGRWRALGRGISTPRLGKGLVKGGPLDKKSKQKAFKAAQEFSAQARSLGASYISLGATQACRAATDGAEFVQELSQSLKLDKATILSGGQEARLSRLGVMSRLEGEAQNAWLADVGGGSTELISLGKGSKPPCSIKIGAVALTEAWSPTDPPAPGEMARLDEITQEILAPHLAPLRAQGVKRLIATAGTAANAASLMQKLEEYQPEKVNNLEISLQELTRLSQMLAEIPLEKRRLVPGMEEKRADIIIAGLAILRGLLKGLGLKDLTAMDAGLLEGILLDGLGFAPKGE